MNWFLNLCNRGIHTLFFHHIAFDDIDVGHGQFAGKGCKLVDRFRRHANHQRRFELRVFGHDVFQEIIDAFPRQAN